MLYSFMDFMIVPLHISYRTTVGVMVNVTDKWYSYQTSTYLNAIYWGFFGASMAIFALHFIYRYLVVSGHSLLGTFNSWKFLLWLSIPMVLGIVWAITGIMLCTPTPEFTKFIKKHVEEMFEGQKIEQFSYLGVFMWDYNEDGSIQIFPIAVPPMLLMSISIMFSFTTIIYFGTKCYSSIVNLTRNISEKTRALQSQLFYALVIQTLIPSLLMHFPVGIKFALAILDMGAGAYCSLVSMTIAIYPAIDPLPTFFIISPYRRAIVGWLRKVLPKSPQPASTTCHTY